MPESCPRTQGHVSPVRRREVRLVPPAGEVPLGRMCRSSHVRSSRRTHPPRGRQRNLGVTTRSRAMADADGEAAPARLRLLPALAGVAGAAAVSRPEASYLAVLPAAAGVGAGLAALVRTGRVVREESSRVDVTAGHAPDRRRVL